MNIVEHIHKDEELITLGRSLANIINNITYCNHYINKYQGGILHAII